MADGIRKPWLLDYLVSYAEQHGCQLSNLQPKKGKVQIINFRTFPESPNEWVWADVSDKGHAVPVRFTMEAVQAFNKDFRNEGRRLTSRRWGIASVRCTRPLLCKPPSQNGTGLEEKWTLALEIDHVEVTASEGEVMFGEPKSVTKEVPIRRWIDGLREPHGAGGNVLKLERLERERKQKELHISADEDRKFESHQQPLDAMFKAESHARSNEKFKKPEGKLQKWRKRMKELGLVQTQKCHRIPEAQMKQLNEITVFGLDLTANDIPTLQEQDVEEKSSPEYSTGSRDGLTGTEMPPKSTPQSLHPLLPTVVPEAPTTPSQWSISHPDEDQSLDGEAAVSIVGSPLHQEFDRQPKDEDLEYQIEEPHLQEDIVLEEQKRGNLGAKGAVEEEFLKNSRDELEVNKYLNDSPHQLTSSGSPFPRSIRASSTMPAPSGQLAALPSSTNEPVVLAPDSDIIGSQSYTQSQSLTQHSLSQPSTSSQYIGRKGTIPKPSPYDFIPESSYPRRGPTFSNLSAPFDATRAHGNDGEGDTIELESDDEAAEKMIASNDANLDGQESLIQDITTRPRLQTPSPLSQERLLHNHDTRVAAPNQRPRGPRNVVLAQVQNKTLHSPSATGIRGTKRSAGDITSVETLKDTGEPVNKRRRRDVPGEIVVQRVEHDVDAWRAPSFTSSRTKKTRSREGKLEAQQYHDSRILAGEGLDDLQHAPQKAGKAHRSAPGLEVELLGTKTSSVRGRTLQPVTIPQVQHAPYEELPQQTKIRATATADRNQLSGLPSYRADSVTYTSEHDEVDSQNHPRMFPAVTAPFVEGTSSQTGQKLLKLGGWLPRKGVPNGHQIMTWEKFNRMLLGVGRTRESNAQRKREL